MQTNTINHFRFDYKQILIDEIALDGLGGIGLDLLWRRLEARISAPVTDKMKERFWPFIINSKSILFYQLVRPVVHLEILDRFKIIDEESGHIKDPDNYLDGPYDFHPIENEYGSCKDYNRRTLLAKNDLQILSYDKIVAEYGDTLVLVASIEERWRALAPHMPISYLYQMLPVHYCILELIGRSRENGQMTTGKTNITKIVKEPKTMFYNRKHLQDLDLIRVQYVTLMLAGRGVKGLLLRLKRFHRPKILTMPKMGVLHNLVQYLLDRPDYTEKTDILINKKMLTPPQMRKLRKTLNVFSFDERAMPSEGHKGKTTKRRFINLSSKSDESSHSEDETTETPLKCQYKVGVSLMRQAYELFLEAGRTGLTQVELSELLGIEFYTTRFICRIFKSKNIVREFLEDKGRQRMARFIAIASTGKMDLKYAEEKKKFMDYLTEYTKKNYTPLNVPTPSTSTKPCSESNSNNNSFVEDSLNQQYEDLLKPETLENNITEIKVLSQFENKKLKSIDSSDRNLSLRQLKFANGLLKVINEKLCICGYQSLSNLVASEIGELPMDTKCLKAFLQKLVNSGNLKLYRVKWPGFHKRYSNFVCAPNVKPNDPIIRAKYKEISIRAVTKKKSNSKKDLIKTTIPMEFTHFAIPRYMKIQKLHEFLMNFVYFNPVPPESHELSQGFVSVVDFIPELTVEFALGNITNTSHLNIQNIDIDAAHSMKLRDTPPDLYNNILQSTCLMNTIRLNLKILAMLGLLQLIYQPAVQTANHNNSGPSMLLLYVNLHAKIVDTRGLWPRPNVDIESLEKSFHFQSHDDVKTYWNVVYNVSINTKVVLPKRERKKLMPPLRLPNEVQNHDNGQRHGDGLGACGFDSCFYMEIPRLWQSVYVTATKSKQGTKRKLLSKLSNLEKSKKQKRVIKKRCVGKIKITRTNEAGKQIRKRINDAALPWTKEEDNIVVLCKAAINIMSPGSRPGCLTIRNLVAKDLLAIKDPKKTQSACHRRAIILESSSTSVYEMECIINLATRKRHLIEKYEEMLKKIRLRNVGNMAKYMSDARLSMLELVWILFQISRSKSFTQRIPCVATNLEEFHEKFTITPASSSKSSSNYRSPENAALREAIVLTIMLSFNYEAPLSIRKEIYTVFRIYPEIALRIALDQLRKSGAVSAKEKVLNNQMHKFNFKDMVQTSYKISANYQRKWVTRLNAEFADNIGEIMDQELSQSNVKGSSEINCLLCEMQACEALEVISATVPVIIDKSGTSIVQEEQLNVIDIETKYKLKSGSLGWKSKCNFKKFSDLENDRPQFEEILQSISRSAVVEPNKNEATPNTEDNIISHLSKKGEVGSTFQELMEITGYDTNTLVKQLTQLESDTIIMSVGYNDNIIVLNEYTKAWSVRIGEKDIIPTPWLALDGRIRYDIFLKWAGVIMSKIFEYPGCSIAYLSDVCEFLSNRGMQDICVFLDKTKCVTLHNVARPQLDLFSDIDEVQDLSEFNKYDSVQNILVFPVKNALTKYSCLRKLMLEFNERDT